MRRVPYQYQYVLSVIYRVGPWKTRVGIWGLALCLKCQGSKYQDVLGTQAGGVKYQYCTGIIVSLYCTYIVTTFLQIAERHRRWLTPWHCPCRRDEIMISRIEGRSDVPSSNLKFAEERDEHDASSCRSQPGWTRTSPRRESEVIHQFALDLGMWKLCNLGLDFVIT
jgi:hypothetical protein